MRVRWILKTHFEQAQKTIDIRLVVIAQPFFLLDGFALVVEVLLGYGQRTHPIAFEPECQRQLVCWQRLEIVCALTGCGSVHRAAGVRNVLKVPGLRHVFRSLKHHVFEQMRKACTTRAFVSRTDVVINRNRYDGDRAVLVQNHTKAIVEGELIDRCMRDLKSFLHRLARFNPRAAVA